MHSVKNIKTNKPKHQGLRGQPCMPAKKFRSPMTPMKRSK